jgi:hypothetical protein
MMARGLWHASLTDDVIVDAVKRWILDLDDPGFCLICGQERGGCEPDARNYECESCGADQVFGAEELLSHINIGG